MLFDDEGSGLTPCAETNSDQARLIFDFNNDRGNVGDAPGFSGSSIFGKSSHRIGDWRMGVLVIPALIGGDLPLNPMGVRRIMQIACSETIRSRDEGANFLDL